MTHLTRMLNGLSEIWAEIAWAVGWQALVVLGIVAIIARAMRHSSPALRYWLWQIAAMKLLLMPSWGTSVDLPLKVGQGLGLRQEAASAARDGGSSGLGVVDGRPRPSQKGGCRSSSGRPAG